MSAPGGNFPSRGMNSPGDASASEMHHREAIGAVDLHSKLTMFGRQMTKYKYIITKYGLYLLISNTNSILGYAEKGRTLLFPNVRLAEIFPAGV
jgi:hypothetical protein